MDLEPGRVYRTAALRRWGKNPTRLAARLAAQGRLRRLAQGLFYAPRQSRFGEVPPSDEALLDALLGGTPYVLTGPPRWNALGLGATALFTRALVYNTKWTGVRQFGRRCLEFRRTAFPPHPPAEWFVVDLLRHSDEAGVDRRELERNLSAAVKAGRFHAARLVEMATAFGGRAEQELVRRALSAART